MTTLKEQLGMVPANVFATTAFTLAHQIKSRFRDGIETYEHNFNTPAAEKTDPFSLFCFQMYGYSRLEEILELTVDCRATASPHPTDSTLWTEVSSGVGALLFVEKCTEGPLIYLSESQSSVLVCDFPKHSSGKPFYITHLANALAFLCYHHLTPLHWLSVGIDICDEETLVIVETRDHGILEHCPLNPSLPL